MHISEKKNIKYSVLQACMCALFSPKIVEAVAVKGVNNNKKNKNKNVHYDAVIDALVR